MATLRICVPRKMSEGLDLGDYEAFNFYEVPYDGIHTITSKDGELLHYEVFIPHSQNPVGLVLEKKKTEI
jgi:hypothetical protein